MTNENRNKIVDALKLAVRSLTGGKASIDVGTSVNAMCLRILVHRAEYGKVCGSKGKMIRAIKFLFEVCMSRNQGVPIRGTLEEPTYGFAQGRSEEVPAENFDAKEYCGVVKSILSLICVNEISFDLVKAMDWQERDTHIFKIKHDTMEGIPSIQFREAFCVMFTAIAKASGGNALYKFDNNSLQ